MCYNICSQIFRKIPNFTKFFIPFCRYYYLYYAIFEYKSITIVNNDLKLILWRLAAEKTEKCRQDIKNPIVEAMGKNVNVPSIQIEDKRKAAQHYAAPLKKRILTVNLLSVSFQSSQLSHYHPHLDTIS